MSKFTQQFTTTYEGGKAIELTPEVELFKICLTSFLEDNYYEKQKDLVTRILGYADKVSGNYLLKLAIFSREYGLRSINHLLIAFYVKKFSGQLSREVLYRVLNRMIKRPDELLEILGALSWLNNGKFVLPNSLKETYRLLFQNDKFDEYQLMKYKGKNGIITLYQLINLVRPKNETVSKFMKGELKSADTWEVSLSEKGNNKETWERLMSENKLGTLAMIRNIRNMIEAKVDEDLIVSSLNKANLKGIFPFQIINSIYVNKTIISKTVLTALENVAYKSFDNLPLEGKTAVLVDTSASMNSNLSSNSIMTYRKLGAFYGALVAKKGYDVYAWADRPEKAKIYADDGLLRIIDTIERIDVGYGTDLQSAIEKVKNDYDNVLVFSDMQTATYVKNTGKIQNLFLFNLCSYENSIAIKGNMIEVAGFNDEMFKLGLNLKNSKAIVNKINEIEL